MTTTADGRQAESLVAEYLESNNHKILSKNWRTRWCEIDIVSRKKKTIYFTEVKFRNSDRWGSGFDYINPKKLRQMQFAAEIWIADNKWEGEVAMQAAEVDQNYDINIVEI